MYWYNLSSTQIRTLMSYHLLIHGRQLFLDWRLLVAHSTQKNRESKASKKFRLYKPILFMGISKEMEHYHSHRGHPS